MLHDSVLAGRPGINLEQVVCHFDDGDISPQVMREAWQTLSDQQPVLRCVCVWRDGDMPYLQALNHVEIRLDVEEHDLPDAAGRAERLAQWLQRDRQRGIDVETAPCWRLTLLRWSPKQASLVWTFHHLLLDGPSFANLLQEALRFYAALQSGQQPERTLPAAPSFADHGLAVSQWQQDLECAASASRLFNDMLEGVSVPEDASWGQELAQALCESTTPAAQDAPPQAVRARLPKTETDQLKVLCESAQVTLGNAVQVAWGLVLSRWTGRSEPVFGVTRSGRYLLPGATQTLGCLINTLPVCLRLRHGLSLHDLLSAMRQQMLDLRPFEHAALTDVRSWGGMSPSANLLGTTVLFEPRPLHRRMQEAGLGHIGIELHEQGSPEASLLVYVDGGLDLHLEYAPAWLDEAGASRLLASVQQVLQAMSSASLSTPVAVLDMLTETEATTLARWSIPAQPIEDATACVATRFAEQARASPTAVAVSEVSTGEMLSYAELDARANRLSHALKARGVGPGDRIALCFSRNTCFIVSMLAVMKSGAAYVPVDPTYPQELVSHMIGDSQAKLLLTTRADRPTHGHIPYIQFEEIEQEIAALPASAPVGTLPIERPAYVIYTSGSTGLPKGVVVSHRALACHAQAAIDCYGLQACDRVLQFASLSFDVSIEEIVPTLLAGAELVLRSDETAESVSALLELVRRRELTVLNLPTAFWHTCVEAMSLGGLTLPASLRLLVVGGEKASRPLLDQWRRIHPHLRWINGYGPTETAITCSAWELDKDSPLPADPDIPIGRPFGHARAFVLAADGSLAPPRARGKLFVGGPCLADGYWALDTSTAEQFLATRNLDPRLPALGHTRLYRTGDIVRWDAAGQLRYLGRKDGQVKVRGYRIELSAVQSALERLDGVGQAVVRVEHPGEPMARLLAWVLPQPGHPLTTKDLEAKLAHSLPAHMRPALQMVSAWPTTRGGKVDVQRLPAHQRTDSSVTPSSDVDEGVGHMMQIFASTLSLPAVGPDDSFFDLGGHSLLAVRLIGSIERECGHSVSIGVLKAHPTPRALCAAMIDESISNGPKYLVSIQPEGDRIPLYGVHSLGYQERFYRPLSKCLGQDQPVYGLTTGYTDLHAAELSVEQMAELYLKDILRCQPSGPLALAAVSMCAYVAYELAQQLTAHGRRVECLILFDSTGPNGRTPITSRLQSMQQHWIQLRRRGVGYLLERAVHRMTESRSWLGRMGLLIGRWTGNAKAQAYDHPADLTFVQRLEDAVQRYRPRPYAGRLIILYPKDEAFFDLKAATHNGLGWRPLCSGPIDLIPTPGQHISMLGEPHVVQLARSLMSSLERTSPASSHLDEQHPRLS